MNDIPPPTIEQRFLSATGAIIREWASLEHQLYLFLTIIAGTDQFRARVIWYSFPNFRARLTMLKRLGETFMDEASLKRFRSLLKRAAKLSIKRNALIHTPWTVIEGRKIRLYYDNDDEEFGFNFADQRIFDINNLENFPHAIKLLRDHFIGAVLNAKIYPSPKIHRAQPAHQTPNNAPGQPVSSSEGH